MKITIRCGVCQLFPGNFHQEIPRIPRRTTRASYKSISSNPCSRQRINHLTHTLHAHRFFHDILIPSLGEKCSISLRLKKRNIYYISNDLLRSVARITVKFQVAKSLVSSLRFGKSDRSNVRTEAGSIGQVSQQFHPFAGRYHAFNL